MKLLAASSFALAAASCLSFAPPVLHTITETRSRNRSRISNQLSFCSSTRSTFQSNPERLESSQLFCICINCAWVTNCTAYHFVEEKHEQPHLTEDPNFTPRDGSPTIHVNVRPPKTDLTEAWKEHESETERAVAKGSGHGETVYDLVPQTTIEYDVVKCADFLLDEGCWVRNTPEEIRRANPEFVPT